MKKALVCSPNHAPKKFACQYYRIDVPLRGFEKLGYATCWNDTLAEGIQRSIQGLLAADFDLFWGIAGEESLEQLQIYKAIKTTQVNGEIIVPPTLILDVDDNRDYIHPFNTSYCEQGVRHYPENKLLIPGDKVTTKGSDGSEIMLWEDGVTHSYGKVFSIERNLQEMRTTHRIMRTVHGMTCTVPTLAKYLKEVVGVRDVHVFPNTIIPEDYISYPLIPKDEVRILWQGGMSHYVDWYPLRETVRATCAKYPKVKWVIFGEKFDWITDIIPESQLEYHSWVDYSAYKMKRGLLQIDINLCPLADNLFNRCKSAIKWYEGSIWDKPEATLAANVPPFSHEMTDGENGLLYSDPQDFAHKLGLLIESSGLRNKLAANAKTWVMANRTPEVTIPPLWEFYESLQQRRLGEFLLSR